MSTTNDNLISSKYRDWVTYVSDDGKTKRAIQFLNEHGQYQYTTTPPFKMIDNYIYMYHTDTLIVIPTFPETIADSMAVTFNSATPLSRSAPIFSYSNSGPRSFQITLSLHRDMMNSINTQSSTLNSTDILKEDYVDILTRQLQAMALPKYSASEKMVNPPIIAVRFGNEIFCKGVVTGAVTVTYSGPILSTDKYAQVDVDFTISEVDPYDAESVMELGSLRGLNLDLERDNWRKKT